MIPHQPYSPEIRDHIAHPRNRGEPEYADAVGTDENPVCGDVMTVWLHISEGVITGARFEARGCEPSIAAGSFLTEMVRGQTLEEAAMVQVDAIDTGLGGLPRAKRHAAALAVTALRNALAHAHDSTGCR